MSRPITSLLFLALIFSMAAAAIPSNWDKVALVYGLADTTEMATADTLSLLNVRPENYKFPGRALLYSGILPGAGELYAGKWKRAVLFAGLEVAAWTMWLNFEGKGDDATSDYEDYGDENWMFEKWIADFYYWNVPTTDPRYNYASQLFSVYTSTDTIYTNITEGSHYVSFRYVDVWDDEFNQIHGYYPEKTASTNDTQVFGNYLWPLFSGKTAEEIATTVYDSLTWNFRILKDHTFYENIGKYNHFFAGWHDEPEPFEDLDENGFWTADEPYVDTNENGIFDEKYIKIHDNGNYLVALNKYNNKYATMREDANDYKKIAGYFTSAIMINHVVSMLDAVFATHQWNSSLNPDISAQALYDPRTPYGIGGVSVSISW